MGKRTSEFKTLHKAEKHLELNDFQLSATTQRDGAIAVFIKKEGENTVIARLYPESEKIKVKYATEKPADNVPAE